MTKEEQGEMLITINVQVKEIHKKLFGNGQPGLVDEFQIVKNNQKNCRQGREKTFIMWVALGAAIAPTLFKLLGF